MKSFKLSKIWLPPALFGFLISVGCSGLGKMSKKESALLVPAGVDSAVAARADSVASELFVPIEQEETAKKYKAVGMRESAESDSLWEFLAATRDSFKVSESDSLQAIEAFNAGARNLQALARLEKKYQEEGLSKEVIEAEVKNLLNLAKKNFEKAVVLNPFDLETRSWLGKVYQSLAARFLSEDDHKRAVKILENLIRIEKGEHALYARLAESYYALENWPAAYQNFSTAEVVLRQSRGLDFSERDYTQDVPLDTSALFYYVYYQGDTESKMHQAERALMDLNRALDFAATDQERTDIKSYIDWINWDSGNIAAVELRDRSLALQQEEKYKEAAKGYEQLLEMVTTQKARDEINWRLALLEFQHVNKSNEGIDRLKQVIKFIEKDNYGAPVDSSYQRYFNSYGIMCHNLGLENYKKDRKIAFMYFKQAVAIAWQGRAKSYLELAKLSRNNPKAVLRNCEEAINLAAQLNQTELMQTYQLLVEASKRMGKFDQARTFFAQWVDLRKNYQRGGNQ